MANKNKKKEKAAVANGAADPLLAVKWNAPFRQSMADYMKKMRGRSLWELFRQTDTYRGEAQDIIVLDHVIMRLNKWLDLYKTSFEPQVAIRQIWELRDELSDVGMQFPLLQMFVNEIWLALHPDGLESPEYDANEILLIKQDFIDTFGDVVYGSMSPNWQPWSSFEQWPAESQESAVKLFGKYRLTSGRSNPAEIRLCLYGICCALRFEAKDHCCLPLVGQTFSADCLQDDFETVRHTICRFIIQLVELKALLLSQHSEINGMKQKIVAGLVTAGVTVGQFAAAYILHAVNSQEVGTNTTML